MKFIILHAIRFYQQYLSFDTGIFKYLFLTDKACRFSPRCSEYTYQAIEAYGIIYGLWLGFKRIIRCHPWSRGGYDPIPKIALQLKLKAQNSKCKTITKISKALNFTLWF